MFQSFDVSLSALSSCITFSRVIIVVHELSGPDVHSSRCPISITNDVILDGLAVYVDFLRGLAEVQIASHLVHANQSGLPIKHQADYLFLDVLVQPGNLVAMNNNNVQRHGAWKQRSGLLAHMDQRLIQATVLVGMSFHCLSHVDMLL